MRDSKATPPALLRLSNELILQYPSSPTIMPQALADTSDGGLVIAGSLGASEWAAKTDTSGSIQWTYLSDPPQRSPGAQEGQFRCAAEMPDGSIYLVGTARNSEELPPFDPPLLVHLDAQGHLILRTFIRSTPEPHRDVARIRGCLTVNDNLALAGDIHRVIQAAQGVGHPPVTEDYFWFLLIDSNGQVIKSTQIRRSTALQSYAGDLGPLVLTPDMGFLFTATDNVNTAVTKFFSDGSVSGSVVLSGSLHVVVPHKPSNEVQVIGLVQEQAQLITLDDQLRETQRSRIEALDSFLVGRAFETNDQKLLLFGSEMRPSGVHYVSRVMMVDSGLQAQPLSLPFSGDTVVADGGRILTAAAVRRANDFWAARSIVKLPARGTTDGNGDDARPALPSGFVRGAVLDSITVK